MSIALVSLKRVLISHLLSLVGVLCCLCACVPSTPQETPPLRSPEIIAQITTSDGAHLTVSRADLEIAARHKSAPSSRALLERLVELKLLSHIARQKGYERSASARDAYDRALIQRLIRQFESDYKADNIPPHYVERARALNETLFRHAELRRAVHIVLKPARKLSKEPFTDAELPILSSVVERIQSDLKREPVSDARSFLLRSERYKP